MSSRPLIPVPLLPRSRAPFSFICAEDSGGLLEGTIILRARSSCETLSEDACAILPDAAGTRNQPRCPRSLATAGRPCDPRRQRRRRPGPHWFREDLHLRAALSFVEGAGDFHG